MALSSSRIPAILIFLCRFPAANSKLTHELTVNYDPCNKLWTALSLTLHHEIIQARVPWLMLITWGVALNFLYCFVYWTDFGSAPSIDNELRVSALARNRKWDTPKNTRTFKLPVTKYVWQLAFCGLGLQSPAFFSHLNSFRCKPSQRGAFRPSILTG